MAKTPATHPLVTCASATLLALLSGCGTTPLQINQSNVTSGSVDAVWRFTPSGAGGLQVQAEGYRARSMQHLDDSESIYNGTQNVFAGPQDLANRVTVQRAFLGYNHQLFADRPLQLQWFAGLGWSRVRWSSVPQTSTAAPFHWDLTGTGPAGGMLAAWRMTPLLALEAGIFGGVSGWGSDATSVDWGQTELGLALTLAPAARLRLGWAHRSLRTAAPLDGPPDLQADTRGPYVKLAFEFR